MKTKIFLILLSFSLLAVSCDLFGAGTGGIVKTGNGGIDWQPSIKIKDTNQTLSGASISKLAFDPKSFSVLYAATVNKGLFVSKDGGSSWEEMLGKISVLDFAVNPQDSNTIYAAGIFNNNGKVFGTRDGGKSWTEVFSAAESDNSARAIAIDPNNPQSILIGLNNGPIIRSDDGGNTWRLVNNYNDRINQILWNNEAVYIVGRTTGVYKSSDGGSTFKPITGNLSSVSGNAEGGIVSSPVSLFHRLSVSRTNPNVQYLTTDLGLYRSTDSGGNWSQVSMPLRQQGVNVFAVAVAPSSANVVYVSSGAYIYKTLDSGASWLTSDSKTKNSINTIAVNPETPQVSYAGVFLPQ